MGQSMRVFEGSSADAAWSAAFEALTADGSPEGGRGGAVKELLHCAITLTDPRSRWVLPRTPPLNPAFAIAEVVWILWRGNVGKSDDQNRSLEEQIDFCPAAADQS